jgi:ferredoxin-NAD(P)+ reductase (naphthalene dioxygenase ferredoxin-specific)
MTNSRQYTGRVIDVHDVSPDTRRLTVEIDNKQKLSFIAGQYVGLELPGFAERPFSIASAPHEPLLEFHVKNNGQGLSAHIVGTLQPGSPVALRGPLGTGHWRPTARPLLALAGGLGIAPLKSIIDACLYDRAHPPVHLYWGAKQRQHLYLDDYFRGLNKKHPRFSYIPVLSEEKEALQYRTGLAGAAAAEDFGNLSGLSIYMAGPTAMIEATLPLLLQKGAEEDYIFSDGFRL